MPRTALPLGSLAYPRDDTGIPSKYSLDLELVPDTMGCAWEDDDAEVAGDNGRVAGGQVEDFLLGSWTMLEGFTQLSVSGLGSPLLGLPPLFITVGIVGSCGEDEEGLPPTVPSMEEEILKSS